MQDVLDQQHRLPAAGDALTVAQTKTGTAVVPFAGLRSGRPIRQPRQTMKATYAAPGFNANVESPICMLPAQKREAKCVGAVAPERHELMSEAPVIGLMRSLSATNRIPKGDRECASSPGSRRSRRS